jgi:hypothetical protein
MSQNPGIAFGAAVIIETAKKLKAVGINLADHIDRAELATLTPEAQAAVKKALGIR